MKKGKKKTPKTSKAKKGADKRKCFRCNQDWHWKRNCPKYLAEKKVGKAAQGKYDLLVVETWKLVFGRGLQKLSLLFKV
ncbi:gag/pol protein [Cucumis melo var. makuwa]|uniref:Gag/pol protein n=1 Tax=Cucumis melo var. makuwa TaxID=1194695 RepID=A0A5A7UDJ7_CUCMM|nr:gag/pol protein [Cucumis melo var. makuwa]